MFFGDWVTTLSIFSFFIIIIIFFIFYILCLHSKWFSLSWLLPPHKFPKPSSLLPFSYQTPPTSLSLCSPTMLEQAFSGSRTTPSFFLGVIWYVNCVLGILSFWANFHLSVTVFHVYSFVIGLPHLGWYFPDFYHLSKNFMNSLFLIAEYYSIV